MSTNECTTDQTIELIRQWFHDKGIIANSNPIKQLEKTQEELNETRDAVVMLNQFDSQFWQGLGDHGLHRHELYEAIKDGIGDTLVTLIGVCEMGDISLMQLIDNENNKTFVDALPDESIKVLDKAQQVLTDIVINRCIGRYASCYSSIGWLGCCMVFLSEYYGFTMGECLQQAYDVISKRKGKMIDGKFVKEGGEA